MVNDTTLFRTVVSFDHQDTESKDTVDAHRVALSIYDRDGSDTANGVYIDSPPKYRPQCVVDI